MNPKELETKSISSPQPAAKLKTNDGTKYLFTWFRLLGILMPDKYKFFYVIYALIVNLFSLIILPLTFSISYFTGSEKMEINHILTSLQAAINVYACATKFIIIAFLRQRLFKIEAILEKLDLRINHPDEIREVEKVIKFGNHTVIFFFCAYFSYSTTTFVGSVIIGRPPYSLYIPFLNWRDSALNFAIVSFLEYLLIDIACFQEVANDSYAVIYIGMVHAHLRALIMRVLRIGTDQNVSQKENYIELVRCIQDHKNIIDLINAVAPVISPTVFIQFTVSALALGTAIINIAISGESRSTIIGSAFFFIALVMEILPICYFVNCLVAEGECLPTAIFHMNWLDQGTKFRRLCLFFMHRSQQPLVFFAGKIFPITLNTFVAVIKCSFSFYTLLSTMDLSQIFG